MNSFIDQSSSFWNRLGSRRIQAVSVMLTAVLLLSSCAGMPSGGSSRQNALDNAEETTIFLQAVGVGAGVGLGVGLLACNKMEGSAKDLCIALATTAGAGIGYMVALDQINTISQIRLQNEQMEALLSRAQSYNSEVASYNAWLKQEVEQLKRSGTKGDMRHSMIRLKSAQGKRSKVMEAINVRRNMAAKLADSGQRRQYEETLRKLEAEDRQLEASIRDLEQIGQARIGA